MSRFGVGARVGVVSVGVVVLVGVAGAAFGEEYGSGDVEVSVEIPEIVEPGVLALSVAGSSVALSEEGSSGEVRQFTGSLPTVTVTDTRSVEEIGEGSFWYVLGSSTDFVGSAGQASLGAEHLGWAPSLIEGGESGLVAAGDEVDTVLDAGPDNVGLVDQELLALASDSQAVAGEGSWTASADLFLRTPVDVAPGGYAATLTLSLFE